MGIDSLKLRRGLKLCAFGAFSFVVVSSFVLAGVAYAYKDKYYPGVEVAGVNLSGKTEKEGAALVEDKAASFTGHPVVVTIPDISKPRDEITNAYPELEIPTTAQGLGLEVNYTEGLTTAWAIGHSNQLIPWLRTSLNVLFNGRKLALPFTVDQTKTQTFILTEVAPKIVNPTPAKIVVKDGVVSTEEAKPGLEVDKDQLAKELAKSLESVTDHDPTYLKAPAKEKESSVTLASIQPTAQRLEDIAGLTLRLQSAGLNLTPKKEQFLNWFNVTQSESGEISVGLQKEVIAQYLLAYNKQLDQAKSLDAVVKALTPLLTQEVVTVAPKKAVTVAVVNKPNPVITPGAVTLGKFEGKYIEVNLKDQKLYLINGANLEKTYVVSTGKWSTPTPVGEFTINGKVKRAYSASYGLYMPYWMNFLNNEYGLHELPEWPNGYKEGQSHLGTAVSHGCIRLGVGSAEEVYNWTENGTPLYIH